MYKKLYRRIIHIICLVMALQLIFIPVGVKGAERFSDVPANHWADNVIHELRALGITEGIGNNNFGLGMQIKRNEFAAFLVKLMKWELVSPEKGSFDDNMDRNNWYYQYVETAVKHGVILKDSTLFRPEDSITREEMAVMIVRCLGYDSLAKQLGYLENPFDDVTKNTGYITVVKDLGIVSGMGNNMFGPDDIALREHAAAIMIRMYSKLNNPLKELHGFYAIKSYQQKDLINDLNSISFGWSSLEYNKETGQVVLNTTSSNGNSFYVPDGFDEPFNMAKERNITAQLMVFAQNDIIQNVLNNSKIGFVEYIFADPKLREDVINSIVKQVDKATKSSISVAFDGVIIDFEGLKGKSAAEGFNLFLSDLKKKLYDKNKKLYVAVHPKRKPGVEYFDGYDYKTIGELSDKVILMAHDYEAKSLTDADMENGYAETPLAPIDEVYYALRAITDRETGISDLNKIMLQISFGSAQWKIKDGKVINRRPYNPEYGAIMQRISNGASVHYSNVSQSPYIKFYDSNDQTENIVWYEDSRSILSKIKLARTFGIEGISVWRLGLVPDYIGEKGEEAFLNVWSHVKQSVRD